MGREPGGGLPPESTLNRFERGERTLRSLQGVTRIINVHCDNRTCRLGRAAMASAGSKYEERRATGSCGGKEAALHP